MRGITLLAALFLVTDVRRSFVDPAPLDQPQDDARENGGSPDAFDEVKQLQDLKHSFGKTFSVLKTQASTYSEVNGQKESHSETEEQVKEDGKLVSRLNQKVDSTPDVTPSTRVRTEMEVPAQGIHRIEDTAGIVERRNNADKYTSYAGVQYSPLDMAEYVFWTGDEKGVTLAIEEFLQEGLMSREEAIAFLQEIKLNLEFLQNHYTQQRQELQQHAKEQATMIQKALGLDKARTNDAKMNSVVDTTSTRDILALAKKNSAAEENKDKDTTAVERAQQAVDEDYEELLDRLRVADFLYTEYSLEEVIYQLAKVMFSQSLNRGSAEAQEALQKFTSFLETEAEQGHISRNLEKKVLDMLIASLTDTLAEHPHLVSVAREGLLETASGNQLLHQLLMLNPAAPAGNKGQGMGTHSSTKGRENETTSKTAEKTSKST